MAEEPAGYQVSENEADFGPYQNLEHQSGLHFPTTLKTSLKLADSQKNTANKMYSSDVQNTKSLLRYQSNCLVANFSPFFANPTGREAGEHPLWRVTLSRFGFNNQQAK